MLNWSTGCAYYSSESDLELSVVFKHPNNQNSKGNIEWIDNKTDRDTTEKWLVELNNYWMNEGKQWEGLIKGYWVST